MPCIQSDGSLTRSGELLLMAFKDPDASEAAAKETGLPLYRVRSGVRELHKAGLLEQNGSTFRTTALGMEKLEGKR